VTRDGMDTGHLRVLPIHDIMRHLRDEGCLSKNALFMKETPRRITVTSSLNEISLII
jgi:hypothetical protein